jgi:hypothetical protein
MSDNEKVVFLFSVTVILIHVGKINIKCSDGKKTSQFIQEIRQRGGGVGMKKQKRERPDLVLGLSLINQI